jgi:hypothetical protein
MTIDRKHVRLFLIGITIFAALANAGCGWICRLNKSAPIQSDVVNRDTPVSIATAANQVKSERVLFAPVVKDGALVVTMIREADMFDLQTETVNRQEYEETGYGETHGRWPVWVDSVIGAGLAVGGGALIVAGESKSSQNKYEYRNDPQTGQRERKQVPYSSLRFDYDLTGGILVGVSVPFLISAIHNGVSTQGHNVGAPKRVELPTEINPRTVRSWLANTKVHVTLPSGASFDTATDIAGKLVLKLPDKPEDFFPLRYVAVIAVPSKEARYEVPADLSLLPPAARSKADDLAKAATVAKDKYKALVADEKGVQATKGAFDEAQATYNVYKAALPTDPFRLDEEQAQLEKARHVAEAADENRLQKEQEDEEQRKAGAHFTPQQILQNRTAMTSAQFHEYLVSKLGVIVTWRGVVENVEIYHNEGYVAKVCVTPEACALAKSTKNKDEYYRAAQASMRTEFVLPRNVAVTLRKGHAIRFTGRIVGFEGDGTPNFSDVSILAY